jgi:hypothetical protein
MGLSEDSGGDLSHMTPTCGHETVARGFLRFDGHAARRLAWLQARGGSGFWGVDVSGSRPQRICQ